MEHIYALIMAGGEGTRFAPLSTLERPKQFLNFVGDGTFIQQTRRRITELVPTDRILVATNEKYIPLVREQLPDVPLKNIIGEPCKKNTAPCIAYAAHLISNRDPDAVMIVLPSDHVILREDRFVEAIEMAIDTARKSEKLITIGIKPTWPSTDYGYIKAFPEKYNTDVIPAKAGIPAYSFTEKPDVITASKYMDEGCYYWNSGMFVWKVSSILSEISTHASEMSKLLSNFETGDIYRNKFFTAVKSISIDYAIMEKSSNVGVIPCDMGWSDVGTWAGLRRLSQEKGVFVGENALRVMRNVLEGVQFIDKPWGHEEIWAHTNNYVGKILVIHKPHRLSYQYHQVKEETIRLLEGVMDFEFEANGVYKRKRLNPGDVFHIPPHTKHRMSAVEDCRVLEVSTSHLDDVVRVQDDYNRN